jgi:hypothetical protein
MYSCGISELRVIILKDLKATALMTSERQYGRCPEEHGEILKLVYRMRK